MKLNNQAFEESLLKIFGKEKFKDDDFCKRLWSSLANVDWFRPKLDEEASYSFRGAGVMIARLREEGNYIDWYCCGPDAVIDDEIRRALRKDGWLYSVDPEICDEEGCLEDVSCGWCSEEGYRNTCYNHYKGKLKNVKPE